MHRIGTDRSCRGSQTALATRSRQLSMGVGYRDERRCVNGFRRQGVAACADPLLGGGSARRLDEGLPSALKKTGDLTTTGLIGVLPGAPIWPDFPHLRSLAGFCSHDHSAI